MHDTSQDLPFLQEAVIFLIAAGLIVPLLQRFRISGVLGYLVIGMAIGPYGLGRLSGDWPVVSYITIHDLAGVRQLAELGIVFLLFTIGLELSPRRLWRMRTHVIGLGGSQILLTGAVIGLIAYAFGNSIEVATILGLALALSSTAIVMQLLADQKRTTTAAGRASFSVLLMQDLAVVPLLVLVGLFSAGGEVSIGWIIGEAILKAALAIGAILLLGRLVVKPVFRFVGARKSPELFMAVTLLLIIGTAAVTGASGLSMALGAFLAGLLLSETEYRHQIEADIEPFKGLLLALFFVSVGMGIDLAALAHRPVWLALSVGGLIALKAAIAAPLALSFGVGRAISLELGLLLAQGGEFAFVVIGMSEATGLIPERTAQFMLIVTGLTMMLTPFTAALARRAGAALETAASASPGTDAFAGQEDVQGHVVIAGYGRVGQMLSDVLQDQGIGSIALDLDAVSVARARKENRPVFFGDAARAEILRRAACDKAEALVITMDSPRASEEVLRVARATWPDLKIYARAHDIEHARVLRRGGANGAVPETLEASLQLAQDVMVGLGVPSEAAWRQVEGRRAFDIA